MKISSSSLVSGIACCNFSITGVLKERKDRSWPRHCRIGLGQSSGALLIYPRARIQFVAASKAVRMQGIHKGEAAGKQLGHHSTEKKGPISTWKGRRLRQSSTRVGIVLRHLEEDDAEEECEEKADETVEDCSAGVDALKTGSPGLEFPGERWNLDLDLKDEDSSQAGSGGLGWTDRVAQVEANKGEAEAGQGVGDGQGEGSGQQQQQQLSAEEADEETYVTRIPVPRQRYIAAAKVELVSTLLPSFPTHEDSSKLLSIFSSLESVLHAEHKSVLEDLRMEYRLAHSPVDEISPPAKATSRGLVADGRVSRATEENRSKDWHLKKLWQRLARRPSKQAHAMSGTSTEDDASPAATDQPAGNHNLGSAVQHDMEEDTVADTQGTKAAERFQRHFMRILRSAQFEGLSARDLQLTAALNSDYLLTLPVDVDWKNASSANALLFRRGYATERQEGLLLGAKLDYLQSVALLKMFKGFAGPLFRAGRWCIQKWESLDENEEGRALTQRIERWLEEPLQPDTTLSPKSARMDADGASEEDEEEEQGMEIWKAARQAVPRYEAVLSSAGARGMLVRQVLVRMGLLPPESPTLSDPHSGHPEHPPHMRPKTLARVSMRDIWRPASRASCDKNVWRQIQAAFSIFFSRSVLQEPAFQELVLLYTKAGSDDEAGSSILQLHTYTRIPLPDLKVVFPRKKLSFRILDTVRLDLASLAGLVAFSVSHRFDDLLSSPSAFVLDVIASVALVGYVARVALGYKQTFDRYQLLVNKTLYEKTLASGFGVVHFLVDASEEQQFKEAILVYSLLLLEGNGQSMSPQQLANICERYLYNNFKEQIEMPIHEATHILIRLGLVIEDKVAESDGEEEVRIRVVPEVDASRALQQRWQSLLSKQSIWSTQ